MVAALKELEAFSHFGSAAGIFLSLVEAGDLRSDL